MRTRFTTLALCLATSFAGIEGLARERTATFAPANKAPDNFASRRERQDDERDYKRRVVADDLAAAPQSEYESGSDQATLAAPLDRPPIDPPLIVTGGFGEFRQGHFHAGLDLSTGGKVGTPVYAPRAGWIERVRSSGVGYGRSIYLHTDDGRLLVFGHLDAYDEPLASWVESKRDSSGQYEQDLWPEPNRFPVRSGQRIAWSGQSGAGGPHLHFEIRRGDMALNPLRAGLWIPDRSRPTIPSLTLEPLDEASLVDGAAMPRTVRLGAAVETLEVIGSVRVTVDARDGFWRGVDRMVPWSIAMESGGARVECRFDSISWATDMPEAEYVYDLGRARGEQGLTLWAPVGFRPRVILSSEPPSNEAGRITMRVGDPDRALVITERDLGGNLTLAKIVLRASRAVPRVAIDAPSVAGSKETSSARFRPRLRCAALPEGALRVTLTSPELRTATTVDLMGPHSFGVPLSGSGDSRSFVIPPRDLPFSGTLRVSGGGASKAWTARGPDLEVVPMKNGAEGAIGPLVWTVPEDGLFEPAALAAETLGRPAATAELEPLSEMVALHPDELAMRKPMAVGFHLDRTPPANAGLFRGSESGWSWVTGHYDSTRHAFESDTRHLGRFAIFRDVVAPRIGKVTKPRRAPHAPYSRWALEARLDDHGSEVDARASYFVVDGKRVPSEWDDDASTLRWRPLAPPARGPHRYGVTAVDHAGNQRSSSGSFVLD